MTKRVTGPWKAHESVRLWARVEKTDSCWLWRGYITNSGYGLIYETGVRPRKTLAVHRVAYESLVGPIPEGMQLDHLCRNRTCVNPEHLQPVSLEENTLRGREDARGWEVALAEINRIAAARGLDDIASIASSALTPRLSGGLPDPDDDSGRLQDPDLLAAMTRERDEARENERRCYESRMWASQMIADYKEEAEALRESVGRLEEALRAIIAADCSNAPTWWGSSTEHLRSIAAAALAGVETGPGKQGNAGGAAGGVRVEDGAPSGAPE